MLHFRMFQGRSIDKCFSLKLGWIERLAHGLPEGERAVEVVQGVAGVENGGGGKAGHPQGHLPSSFLLCSKENRSTPTVTP